MNHAANPVSVRRYAVSVSILVVGSINMDLVARCPRIPTPGETILGSDFTRSPGGKGANGATAAARLLTARAGGRVAMLGRMFEKRLKGYAAIGYSIENTKDVTQLGEFDGDRL